MKHSRRFREAAEKTKDGGPFELDRALELLKETANAKFDETVEVAFRLGVDPRHSDQQVRGTIVMPHGTGQSVKVLVLAKGEKVAEAEEAGADFVGAEDYIEKVKQQLESKGMTVDHHVPYGDPAAKILEVCELYNYDLIAMSTHGRSGLGRWLMGSVADKVVRHSRFPVLLRRAQPEDVPEAEAGEPDDAA